MAKQKRIKCSKCDRRFSMQAHLARHMNTMHGTRPKKVGRSRRGRKMRRRSMPARAMGAVGLNFAGLSLAQLCTLIDAAREEAKRRLELV